MSSRCVCTLCGADGDSAALLGGASGYVCFSCLGEAFDATAKAYAHPRGPESVPSTPPATKRCLICDEPAPAGRLVAYRHPFLLCGACLKRAFEISADEGPEALGVINF